MGRKPKGHPDAWTPDRRSAQREANARYRDGLRRQLAEGDQRAVAKHLLVSARTRCWGTDRVFDLVPEDILPLPSVCPILGIPLELGASPNHQNNYSIDRFDPSRGYVRGNVTVVSYRANMLKNNGTEEEHRRIADWMSRRSIELAETPVDRPPPPPGLPPVNVSEELRTLVLRVNGG